MQNKLCPLFVDKDNISFGFNMVSEFVVGHLIGEDHLSFLLEFHMSHSNERLFFLVIREIIRLQKSRFSARCRVRSFRKSSRTEQTKHVNVGATNVFLITISNGTGRKKLGIIVAETFADRIRFILAFILRAVFVLGFGGKEICGG